MEGEQHETRAGRSAVLVRTGDTVRLAEGIVPRHLELDASDDGQYLLIRCGREVVAMFGAMGGCPDAVQFADGARYSLMALLDLLAAD